MYLSKIKNISTETYSFDLIFWNNNHFQDDKVRISPQKWTLKFENAQFLSAHQYSNLKYICSGRAYAHAPTQ